MLKTLPIIASIILCACSSDHKPSQSALLNFYDTHLFFDMDTETTQCSCTIQGKIPSWLSGTLLRNGPAKFSVDGKRVDWFDGLAMLHAFEFTPQQVLYSNRFIRCEQYYIMMVEKSLNFSGFAHDPCSKVFKNQTTRFIPKEMQNVQNAGVTIQQYADMMVALTETPLPVVFDPQTLATIGNFEYQDDLPKSKIWESAHAQHDISAGETYNYLINFGQKSSYVIWKMRDNMSNREVVNEIPVDYPAYMHSFALSEKYQALVEYPFVVNPMDLIEMKKPLILNYKWKPERGTNFYVTERATGKLVAKITDDPFFAFHHVNAYDKDGQFIMDIITFPNPDIIGVIAGTVTDTDRIKRCQKTTFKRFTIDMNTHKLSKETISDENMEMPRVPADRVAHEYRFCYATDYSFPSAIEDVKPLFKVDVQEKKSLKWSEPGCLPGEPIFVPRPGGQSEDDGVVLSVILDFAKLRSFLLILDAMSFKELARAEVPNAIPMSLHGLWKAE